MEKPTPQKDQTDELFSKVQALLNKNRMLIEFCEIQSEKVKRLDKLSERLIQHSQNLSHPVSPDDADEADQKPDFES